MKTNSQVDQGRRKPYIKPEIIEELALETRAGSPLGVPNPLDFLNDSNPLNNGE